MDAQPRPAPEGHSDLSRNWVGAGHLKIGDTIKQADGTTGLVANVTTIQQTREMFNLTVSEAHTYYVGQDGWLVHNQSFCLNAKAILGDSKGNLPAQFYQNQYRTVGADDLAAAADGHPAKHGMPKQTQADILNGWDRAFTGYNNNGRPVDIYMKDGMVVITEFGNKSGVITAYGGRYSRDGRALEASRWTDSGRLSSGEWYWSFNRNQQR